ALASMSFAQMLSVSVFGGYTTLAMEETNNEIDEFEEGLVLLGGSEENVTKENINSAFMGGIDVGIMLSKEISIGSRIALITGASGKARLDDDASDDYFELNMSLGLLPVMAGGKIMFGEEIKAGLSAYGGMGFASGNYELATMTGGTEDSDLINFAGSGMVVDVAGSIGAELPSGVTGGLEVGYRIAKVAEMKTTEENTDMGVEKDEVVENSDNEPMEFDYSGITANVFLTLAF
ncbi:MAG: hypothetical protein ACLFP1_02115, partial [Candidatus Goldiibacteriota bacterium]